MIKNNRLVSFSPGGDKNDFGGFQVKASEYKKASKYQLYTNFLASKADAKGEWYFSFPNFRSRSYARSSKHKNRVKQIG